MTFTGLHNIWYALFDFEFEREVLMSTPVLYTIGMQNLIFNMKEFWIWFLYASAQAAMILFVSFYAGQDSPTEDGQTFNFWAGGAHVYMNCVILANVIILKMQHNYTGFNMVICAAQIGSFFGILWYFSETLEGDVIYKFREEFMASKPAWLGCFFCVASFWTIDSMLHAIRLSLAACTSAEKGMTAAQMLEEAENKMMNQGHSVSVHQEYKAQVDEL